MQFFEREWLIDRSSYTLKPHFVLREEDSLHDLMQAIDLRVAFTIFRGDGRDPIVFHAGGYRGVMFAPIILDDEPHNPILHGAYALNLGTPKKEIVPFSRKDAPDDFIGETGIARRIFSTNACVSELLVSLRKDGWVFGEFLKEENFIPGFLPLSYFGEPKNTL